MAKFEIVMNGRGIGSKFAQNLLAYLTRSIAAGLFFYVVIFTVSFTADYYFKTDSVALLTVTRCALLALCGTYLLTIWRVVPKLLDTFSFTIIVSLGIGAIVGLFGAWDWFTYFRQGFQYCFLLALYLFGKSLGSKEIPEKDLGRFCIAILFFYTVATVLYALYPGLHSGSYSYQPNLAILPLSFGLVSGQVLTSVWATGIVAIGNKRAVLLGACFVAAVLAAGLVSRRYPVRGKVAHLALIGILWPTITITVSVAISSLSKAGLPLLTVADRFTTYQTFAGSAPKSETEKIARILKEAQVSSILRLTSGRNIEVSATWAVLRNAPFGEFLGAGLGARYEMSYTSPANYERVSFWRDQADLFPVHIALTSGIPLAVVMCIAFLWANFRLLLRVVDHSGPDLVILLYILGSVADTMLGFNATNPVVWAAFGYASMRILRPRDVEAAT